MHVDIEVDGSVPLLEHVDLIENNSSFNTIDCDNFLFDHPPESHEQELENDCINNHLNDCMEDYFENTYASSPSCIHELNFLEEVFLKQA